MIVVANVAQHRLGPSLQGELAGITLANPTSRISRFFFNLRSSIAVAGANAQVTSDIVTAIQTYNNGLY